MSSESIAIPHDQMGKPGMSAAGVGYEPTPDEEKAIKLADHLYSKAKQARKAYDEKWIDFYRMFRGRQWKDQRPSYRHAEVINLIFRAIQADVPILTDGMPKPEFIPTEPGDMELAQIFNDLFDSDWHDGSWNMKMAEIIYDSHFYGAGFGSMKYDQSAALGAGRIIFQSEDTFCAFPDPYARNVNERSNYFVWAEPTSTELLKRENPDVAKYIKSDLLDLSKYERANFSENIRYRQAGDSRIFTEGQSQYNLDDKDEALKIDCFIHDSEYCEEEVSEVNKETGAEETKYMQRLKYPNGRFISMASGVLLGDGELPYDDRKFPYLRLINYILPHEFWGISEVEQLESPQKIFNKLISFTLDVLTMMGNPVWVVDTDSEVDTDNLYNRPGLIIEKAKGSEVRREAGVDLQPYVLQLIDRVKVWFDDMSGATDNSGGVDQSGVTAASAIQALQQASQTRLRQKTRNIDAFLQEMGKMYVSRVFQFYDSPRVFRVTGQNNSTRYFKFHVDKVPAVDPITGQQTGDVQKIAKIRTLNLGTDGMYHEGEEKQYQMQGEFDVRVTTGSALPFEKNRIESQSKWLYEAQVIDAEEVLKNIKYPNAEAVLKRMADRAAMNAQAQQDAEMQKAVAKGLPSAVAPAGP